MAEYFAEFWQLLDPFRLLRPTNTERSITGDVLVSDLTEKRPNHVIFLNLEPSKLNESADTRIIAIGTKR